MINMLRFEEVRLFSYINISVRAVQTRDKCWISSCLMSSSLKIRASFTLTVLVTITNAINVTNHYDTPYFSCARATPFHVSFSVPYLTVVIATIVVICTTIIICTIIMSTTIIRSKQLEIRQSHLYMSSTFSNNRQKATQTNLTSQLRQKTNISARQSCVTYTPDLLPKVPTDLP